MVWDFVVYVDKTSLGTLGTKASLRTDIVVWKIGVAREILIRVRVS